MIGENRPKIGTGGDFEPIPSGKYTLQVADVDVVTSAYKGVETDKFKFTFFVLDDVKFTVDEKEQTTRGRKLWSRFSMYLTPRSFLTGFIKVLDPSVLDMSVEAKENYNMDSLIGKQVTSLVDRKPSKDGTTIWNNVTSFEKCEKELEGFTDLPGDPVVINKESSPASVPTEAPVDEVKPESADEFIDSLEKENEVMSEEEIKKEEEKVAKSQKRIADAKAKAKAAKK